MNKANDSIIGNSGQEMSTEEIKESLPDFYEKNKERIESKHIRAFHEPFMAESGVAIDIETNETIFFDYRN